MFDFAVHLVFPLHYEKLRTDSNHTTRTNNISNG